MVLLLIPRYLTIIVRMNDHNRLGSAIIYYQPMLTSLASRKGCFDALRGFCEAVSFATLIDDEMRYRARSTFH